MRNIWHYDIITAFNQKLYDKVFTIADISGDEMSIKNIEQEDEYFYPMKKKNVNYLLPTEAVKDLPIRILESEKISFRSKGYEKILETQSIKITPQNLMSYKDYIDNWMPYKHAKPDEFTLWKIIIDTAYRTRINVRAISFPGWLKDSPLQVLQLLKGDVAIANKPTFAKMKLLINTGNRIIGLNEIQNLKSEEHKPLAKFYEDSGDFKPIFENDSRATGGTSERCDIINLSSLTFYNFPEDDKEKIFDHQFAPKIKSRVFPILLSGGSHKETACIEDFGYVEPVVEEEEYEMLLKFLRTSKYYDMHWTEHTKSFNYQKKYKSVRWQRNFDAICSSISMYAQNEFEYQKYVDLLWKMNMSYMDYITKKPYQSGKLDFENDVDHKQEVIEEEVI